jgi:hypothetical protein
MKGLLGRFLIRRDGFHVVLGILSEAGFVLLLMLGGLALCFLFSLF